MLEKLPKECMKPNFYAVCSKFIVSVSYELQYMLGNPMEFCRE